MSIWISGNSHRKTFLEQILYDRDRICSILISVLKVEVTLKKPSGGSYFGKKPYLKPVTVTAGPVKNAQPSVRIPRRKHAA